MLYMEDEENVRPSWKPYKNDYRNLRIDELTTIEDCDEAILWVNDRITDMHTWLAGINEAEHQRRLKRHISRALYLKSRLLMLKADFWHEEKAELRKELRTVSPEEQAARTERHRISLQHSREVALIKHQHKLERIAASNREDGGWQNEFRELFVEAYGKEAWAAMATQARSNLLAKQERNDE